jgi:LPXTG-site transpeptidase (sortase) family protein
MKKVLVAAAVFILVGLGPNQAQRQVWSQAVTTAKNSVSTKVAHAEQRGPSTPARLNIPSIQLDSPIQPMGLDKYGRMDVPTNRKTTGWYSKGTIPGNKGSAVLDAHVFAAFKNLHKLKVGDEIFVTDKENAQRKFVVQETKYYSLDKLSPEELFNKKDARRLTLITCAGKKTGDERGYDERLVVYAVLAE